VRRGEIWWAELDAPSGKRPVLLLSRDASYEVRALVIIAPVTTRIRHIKAEVPLATQVGLPQNCVVNLDTLTTISKSRLSSRLAILAPAKLKEVEIALYFALGLE
jgi:mRNA interferase MazF